jgi:biotin synthase
MVLAVTVAEGKPSRAGFLELNRLDWGRLSLTETLSVLSLPDERLPELLEAALAVRRKYKGLRVGIQMLTNARSGACTQNCAYCAQARDSKADIPVYRLTPYENLSRDGAMIAEKGLARHCIGLSGMKFSDAEIKAFAEQVRRLKSENDTPVCCSIGFLTPEQAKTLKEAGVDRINHNLNTSRRHYPNICTTHTYDQRVANIRMLQELGFELCCGGIIGMGESPEDIADMLLALRAIDPEAVPINFLIPLEGTGLQTQNTSHLTPEYCLKILCLARLLMPRKDIRCAAGRELYLAGREKDMFAAVDSIFAAGYLTAGGQGIDDTIRLVREAGFEPFLE